MLMNQEGAASPDDDFSLLQYFYRLGLRSRSLTQSDCVSSDILNFKKIQM